MQKYNAFDPVVQNANIQKAIVKSIEKIFPIVADTRTLEISNIKIDDNLNNYDFPEQKEIKLSRKSWQVPITADIRIVDKSGNIISKKTNAKIGQIPKLTNRFTTIIDGNEYQTTNQLRRKPGAYPRIKRNGELESEFNLAKGHNFKLQLDPISELFVMKFKNRKYRLWTLLTNLGVSDVEIAKDWGAKLLEKNKKGALNTEGSELTSIYNIIYKKEAKNFDEVRKGLIKYFTDQTLMDPDVNKITIGGAYKHVNGESLLAASKKLLEIHKGKATPENRDNLIFKDLYAVDDLILSHFDKQKVFIEKKLKRSLGFKDQVRDIVSAATFTKPIKAFFTTGDLTSTPPQTNPVTILTDWRKTTPMGTGGIQQRHAITMETRDIQPSHLGFLDPLSTPEGGKVGVTVGLASEVRKTEEGMKTPVYTKDSKQEYLTPIQFFNSKIGYPDQYEVKGGKLVPRYDSVRIMYKGKMESVPAKEVDYYIRSAKSIFSIASNMVPFTSNTQGNRASTAARMIAQALPIDAKEAPLVQNKMGEGITYEDLVGGYFDTKISNEVLSKKIKATVTKVTKEYIHLKDENGKAIKRGLYNDFPLNQDGFLNSKVLVKAGDAVDSNTVLAENNYSVGNTLALGKNLTTAYLPFKGYNFEDGAVITQSAAEKMAHSSLHKVNIFFTPKLSVLNKEKFVAFFHDEVSQDNLKKLDERGLPKIGETFNPGEALSAFLVEKTADAYELDLKKLSKFTYRPYSKNIKIWDEDETGEVTDVRVTGRNIDIYVKSRHPFKEGDKISGRQGNKYIVVKIIPDSNAPHRADGKPVDIMLNPHGVPGRMNLGQILETAAGKIAEKTGKPYIIDNFKDPDGDASIKIFNEMKDLGIEPDEILTDGKNGQQLKNPIFVGKNYFMKLRHIVKKKQGVHTQGQYDIDEQPTGKGAQKVGTMETYAYLAHGAKNILREFGEIKGRKNEEYYKAIQLGLPPVKPERNFVFDRVVNFLKGAGINTEKKGNKLRILPLTDDDVKGMSSGEITDPGTMLRGKDLATKKDGLFDPEITGGIKGTQWAHIKLAIRIPNPMFEDAIMKALDLTEKGYQGVVQGKEELNGLTGMPAIIAALDEIDVGEKLTALKTELKDAPPTNVNKLNRKIKYLAALKDFKMSPVKAYTMKMLPIIPPVFRPIYSLPSGDLAVNDINKHYAAVGNINKRYKANLDLDIVSEDEKKKYNYDLYQSVKALQGFIEPVTYGKEKYKGILKEIGTMKTGLIHGKAWAKRQDFSARSTITVEPDLGLDEVGIPKKMAYQLFEPFILRDLKESGFKATTALKEYNDESEFALSALDNVIKNRPVLLNRAPSLHKHAVQAFKPMLTEGKSIRLNPLVVKGFGADFDGDTISVMVPFEKEAVEEANNMFPSKILFQHGNQRIVPSLGQDYVLGLWQLSKITGKTAKTFKDINEAKKSKIDWTTEVTIGSLKTTIGQYMINDELPDKLKDYKRVMTGDKIEEMLTIIGRKHPNRFTEVINKWKNLGYNYAYLEGNTISIKDFIHDKSYRDDLLKKRLPDINKLKGTKKIDALNKLTLDVQKAQDASFKGKLSNIYAMLRSGSFTKKDSARQILSMPGVLKDINDEPISYPVLKSYGEGLDVSSYFSSMYGVRKGTVDRSVKTEKSGALNKVLMNVNRRLIVTIGDCNTFKELNLPLDDKNVMDRFIGQTIKGIARRNELVDSEVLLKAKKAGLKTLPVRSPLTCEATEGVCSRCYGLLPDGQEVSIGTNVGILDSTAVTERATQLVMQTFHCFHPGTLVFTEDNECRTLEDLYDSKYTGKVLDKNGRWTQVKEVWRHEVSDKMAFIKTKDGHSLISQANHPMQVVDNTYLCKYCSGRLSKRGSGLRCKTCNRANNKAKINTDISTAFTIEAKDLKIREHAFIMNSFPADFGSKDWDWSIPPYLLGAWIAEGCFLRVKGVPKHIIWSQAPGTAIHKKYGLLLNKKINGKDYCLTDHKLLSRLIKENGTYSNNKKMPYNMLNYSVNNLYELLAGFIDGDGWIHRFKSKRGDSYSSVGMSTTSYGLANQLVILGNALGIQNNIYQRKLSFLSNYQQFDIIYRLTLKQTELFELYSIKIRNMHLTNPKNKIDKGTIGLLQETFYPYEHVYDIKTESGTFIANEIWTHNSGGSAVAGGGGGITAGFPRLEQLLKVPAKLSGKATLSSVKGKVKTLTRSLTGGWKLRVEGYGEANDKDFIIPAGRTPVVKVGDKVDRGDRLSDGVIKPQELSEFKSHLSAQNYIVDEMSQIYGGKFHRKTFETVIRGMSDNADITEAPEDSGFLRGDKTTISYIDSINKDRRKEGLEEVKYTPYLKSIEMLNVDNEDWLTKVTTNRISSALSTGVAKGQVANLKGKDPIPALLYGEDFGKNTNFQKGEFY